MHITVSCVTQLSTWPAVRLLRQHGPHIFYIQLSCGVPIVPFSADSMLSIDFSRWEHSVKHLLAKSFHSIQCHRNDSSPGSMLPNTCQRRLSRILSFLSPFSGTWNMSPLQQNYHGGNKYSGCQSLSRLSKLNVKSKPEQPFRNVPKKQ